MDEKFQLFQDLTPTNNQMRDLVSCGTINTTTSNITNGKEYNFINQKKSSHFRRSTNYHDLKPTPLRDQFNDINIINQENAVFNKPRALSKERRRDIVDLITAQRQHNL